MSKKDYTDLCAFKRFLRSRNLLFNFKKELKKRHRKSGKCPWKDIISTRSKHNPNGLFDIINISLRWFEVTTIPDCPALNRDWNQYWISTCGMHYYMKYRNKMSPVVRQRLIESHIIKA